MRRGDLGCVSRPGRLPPRGADSEPVPFLAVGSAPAPRSNVRAPGKPPVAVAIGGRHRHAEPGAIGNQPAPTASRASRASSTATAFALRGSSVATTPSGRAWSATTSSSAVYSMRPARASVYSRPDWVVRHRGARNEATELLGPQRRFPPPGARGVQPRRENGDPRGQTPPAGQVVLLDALSQVEDNAAIASPARVAIEERAERASALRAEIERRIKPEAGPGQPWSPAVEADLAGDGVHEPASGPVVTAVADGPTAGNDPGFGSAAAVAGVEDGEDSRRRQERPPMLDTLAQAEQAGDQHLRGRAVRNRQAMLAGHRRQPQPGAGPVGRHQAVCVVRRDQRGDRTGHRGTHRRVARRAPQSRIGRPALRGPAREELAEELTGLINAKPALRSDPVLRVDRWSTIIERAQSAEQQQTAELRAQLDGAIANVADNAAIVNDAASGIDSQTERRDMLSAEMDARATTPAAGDGDTPEAGMAATRTGRPRPHWPSSSAQSTASRA